MELPRRYPYNPQWRPVAVFLAVGAGLFALAGLRGKFWTCAPMGAVFFILGLLGTARCFVFRRFLELGQDAMLLPTGFLHRRTTKISYADIEWVKESFILKTPSLSLGTKGRTIQITSRLLTDRADFAAVRDFLTSLPGPKERALARQRQPSEPGKYCFQCTYEGNGAIYDSKGEIIWHVKTPHFNNRPHYPYGFFRLPDFVAYDKTDKEWIRIKRERRFLAAQFVMLENGKPVGRIVQHGILKTQYRLDFAGGSKWTFRLPLFTVIFRGQSDTGARIQVRLRTHNIWYVLMDSHADNPRLVAALAFIHRERLRCN